MHRLRLLALVLLVVATAAHAQSSTPLTTTPSPAPEGTPLSVQAQTPGCSGASAVVVNGFTIDVTVATLPLSGPCGLPFQVGPLSAGTYTVRFFYSGGGEAFPPGTLIVAPAPVPAIEPRMLALLAVILIAIAGFALRAHA